MVFVFVVVVVSLANVICVGLRMGNSCGKSCNLWWSKAIHKIAFMVFRVVWKNLVEPEKQARGDIYVIIFSKSIIIKNTWNRLWISHDTHSINIFA